MSTLWRRLKNPSDLEVEGIALFLIFAILVGGLMGVLLIHMAHDTAESWTACATVSVALIAKRERGRFPLFLVSLHRFQNRDFLL